MNKKLLNELAEKRLAIEKDLAIKEAALENLGRHWDDNKAEINKLRAKKQRITRDIQLICSEKEPKYSEQFRVKKKKKA